MSASTQEISNLINQDYKQGFVTVLETDTFPPGLNEDVIHQLSKVKNEPDFMLEYRLKAFRHWQTMKSPDWAQVKIEPIDYQSISYYSAPKRKEDGPLSLDEIDPQVLDAYKKLGIPLDEQERLAGVEHVHADLRELVGERRVVLVRLGDRVDDRLTGRFGVCSRSARPA